MSTDEPVHFSIWAGSVACSSQIDLRSVRHTNRWDAVTCPACRAWSEALRAERERIADEALTLDDDTFVALIEQLEAKRCLHCGARNPSCPCDNDE